MFDRFYNLFSNREIAAIFWIVVILIVSITKENIRRALFDVFKAFFQWKLLVYYLVSSCYFLLLLVIINSFLSIDMNLLKDALYWFMPSGIMLTAKCFSIKNIENILKVQILDNIKITVCIQYIIATYVFPLVIEVLLIPIIAFISIMAIVSEKEEKYKTVNKLFNSLLFFVGLIIITFVLYSTVVDFDKVIGISSIKSFILPNILMFLYFPLSYFLILFAEYELLFTSIDVIFTNIKKKKLETI
jgi:hypothetical protein